MVDITGAKISFIALIVASFSVKSGFFSRLLSTFSTTKIASSTTIPMARISPNNVNVLIENPAIINTAKVPMRDTGIATAGIIVALNDCKKKYTTSKTKINASMSVIITSFMETSTNLVVS